MTEYRIKNWEQFQNYKDRRPPWVKLHRSIFDDRELMSLSMTSRALLFQLWVIATENDGIIKDDESDIAWRLRVKSVNLNPLISSGFLIPASGCLQALADVVPETETETETETDILSSSGEPDEPDPKDRDNWKALFKFWQEVHGHPQSQFTSDRETKLRARLKEGFTLDDCAAAIRGVKHSKWHMGDNADGRVWDDWKIIFKNAGNVELFRDLDRKKVTA